MKPCRHSGQPGFFKITVCSSRDAAGDDPPTPDFILWPSDQATFTPAECDPFEDAGGPGDRVSVTIDFEHPLIVPIISSVWPQLHLVAKREGIIEQFRTARVVGLPATIGAPTFTPDAVLHPVGHADAFRYADAVGYADADRYRHADADEYDHVHPHPDQHADDHPDGIDDGDAHARRARRPTPAPRPTPARRRPPGPPTRTPTIAP